MKITDVQAMDDYRLLIYFEEGNQVSFNMQRMVQTIPYLRLRELNAFRAVKFDDKAVYWESPGEDPEYMPMRVTVDQILFSLR